MIKLTHKRSVAAVSLAVATVFVLGTSPYSALGQEGSSSTTASAEDSLTIERVVQRVIETHPSIEASRREVDAANARVDQVQSGYWPRVSAVGTVRRQDPVPEVTVPGGGPERSIAIQPNNLYDGHLQVQQTLYNFGQTGARVDQARAGRTAAQRRVGVEQSTVAFEAVRASYTVLLADARIGVQRDQIQQLRRTLDVVRRRQEAGTATEFEIQSTLARLSAARSRLVNVRSQRQSRAAELRRLLGMAPGDSLALAGTLQRPPADRPLASDRLVERALLHHPSVEVAQAQVRAARRRVHVADHSDAPSLALSAQGGVKNGYPGDLNEPHLNESVGLSLRVPLFDGFATSRQIEEAEASVGAAEARLAAARRRVSTQVEQAILELRAHREQLAATTTRVEQARTAAQLARTRYEAGTITNLELLDAETELQRARLSRTEARYGVVLGRYALRHAAGTLLPFSPLSD